MNMNHVDCENCWYFLLLFLFFPIIPSSFILILYFSLLLSFPLCLSPSLPPPLPSSLSVYAEDGTWGPHVYQASALPLSYMSSPPTEGLEWYLLWTRCSFFKLTWWTNFSFYDKPLFFNPNSKHFSPLMVEKLFFFIATFMYSDFPVYVCNLHTQL